MSRTYKLTMNKVEQFKWNLMEQERSEATIEKYIRDINAFFEWLPEGKRVDKPVTIAYKQSLLERGYASSSINSMVAALNSFFSYSEWGDCRIRPLRIQAQTMVSEERKLTKEEYKRLLHAAKMCIRDRVYPMHYHGEELRKMWERNARCIAEHLQGERTGVFITLGDPAVYSTFMYTLPYIEKTGVAVEVVPGVTSFCAVADTMMMPLVAWDEDLVIAPVRKNSSEDLGEILRSHDNICLLYTSRCV